MSNPKFNVGCTCWCILDNKITPVSVTGSKTTETGDVIYSVLGKFNFVGVLNFYLWTINERDLYRTPDELIDAIKAIDYTKVLEDFASELSKKLNKVTKKIKK